MSYSAAAERLLDAHDMTAKDVHALAFDASAAQPVAQLVVESLYEIDAAVAKLRETNYWVKTVAADVDCFVEDGTPGLNSLGVLQATGPALDVAAGRVSLAMQHAELLLDLLVTVR